MIAKKLKEAKNQPEKVEFIWDFYLSRKLSSAHEPAWTHAAYELCLKFLNKDIVIEQLQLLNEVIKSHELQDGSEVHSFAKKPNSPVRIMQDGWKIGSPSWIFMGRNLPDSEVFEIEDGWIGVCRTIEDKYMSNFIGVPNWSWMAYNLTDQMGMSGETNNVIGPSLYVDDIVRAVEDKIKKKCDKAWHWIKNKNE